MKRNILIALLVVVALLMFYLFDTVHNNTTDNLNETTITTTTNQETEQSTAQENTELTETTIEPTAEPVTEPTTEPYVEEETTSAETESIGIVYPIEYSDSSCEITITREWYENAWCYIAHLRFTDYTRFGMACANGAYNKGREKASHAAERLGAMLVVNGDYTTPKMGNDVVRSGVVYKNTKLHSAAIYNANTGLFTPIGKLESKYCSTLVKNGKLTDTFSFFRWVLVSDGKVVNKDTGSRAQRTSIGTTGEAGEIYIVVSDGRYVDGESAGLTFKQCAKLMKQLGCVFAIPLDGGGSSTMVWNGEVLNSAKNNERAVVDFVYFK